MARHNIIPLYGLHGYGYLYPSEKTNIKSFRKRHCMTREYFQVYEYDKNSNSFYGKDISVAYTLAQTAGHPDWVFVRVDLETNEVQIVESWNGVSLRF